jgi:VanZ family protein
MIVNTLDGNLLYIQVLFKNDFITHVSWFSLLSSVIFFAWSAQRYNVVALLLFGVGLEVAQILTPSRHFSLFDLLGNLVGVLIGLVMVRGVRYLHSLLAE